MSFKFRPGDICMYIQCTYAVRMLAKLLYIVVMFPNSLVLLLTIDEKKDEIKWGKKKKKKIDMPQK